jgi:hypothetical protein
MKRIREVAETGVRYGYRRIHVLLRREGWLVNASRRHHERDRSLRTLRWRDTDSNRRSRLSGRRSGDRLAVVLDDAGLP